MGLLLEPGFPLLKFLSLIEEGVFTFLDKGLPFLEKLDLVGEGRMSDVLDGGHGDTFPSISHRGRSRFTPFLFLTFQLKAQFGQGMIFLLDDVVCLIQSLPEILEGLLKLAGILVSDGAGKQALAVIEDSFACGEEEFRFVDNAFAFSELGLQGRKFLTPLVELVYSGFKTVVMITGGKIDQVACLLSIRLGPGHDGIDGKVPLDRLSVPAYGRRRKMGDFRLFGYG